MHRLRQLLRTRRVKYNASNIHERRSPGKLSQDGHALPVSLAGDVLGRNKIHPVALGCYQADVGDAVEGC